MTKTILETCDIWDMDYNFDNWEPEFMTIFQLRVTLDIICNSCNVFNVYKKSLQSERDKRFLMCIWCWRETLCWCRGKAERKQITWKYFLLLAVLSPFKLLTIVTVRCKISSMQFIQCWRRGICLFGLSVKSNFVKWFTVRAWKNANHCGGRGIRIV